MPVILATQEAEIRRIEVRSPPRQIVHKNLSQKTQHIKRAGEVAQGVDSKNKNKNKKISAVGTGTQDHREISA
jgi:hypothetical protein